MFRFQTSAAAASQQHVARAQITQAPRTPQAAALSYDDYEDADRLYYRAAPAPAPAPPAPVAAPSAHAGPGPAPGPVYQAYLQYRRFQSPRTPSNTEYYSTY